MTIRLCLDAIMVIPEGIGRCERCSVVPILSVVVVVREEVSAAGRDCPAALVSPSSWIAFVAASVCRVRRRFGSGRGRRPGGLGTRRRIGVLRRGRGTVVVLGFTRCRRPGLRVGSVPVRTVASVLLVATISRPTVAGGFVGLLAVLHIGRGSRRRRGLRRGPLVICRTLRQRTRPLERWVATSLQDVQVVAVGEGEPYRIPVTADTTLGVDDALVVPHGSVVTVLGCLGIVVDLDVVSGERALDQVERLTSLLGKAVVTALLQVWPRVVLDGTRPHQMPDEGKISCVMAHEDQNVLAAVDSFGAEVSLLVGVELLLELGGAVALDECSRADDLGRGRAGRSRRAFALALVFAVVERRLGLGDLFGVDVPGDERVGALGVGVRHGVDLGDLVRDLDDLAAGHQTGVRAVVEVDGIDVTADEPAGAEKERPECRDGTRSDVLHGSPRF